MIEIDFPSKCPMRLYGDNKIAIHIAENNMFDERTKHIEVDSHIVHKRLEDKSGEACIIRTPVSRSFYQTTW